MRNFNSFLDIVVEQGLRHRRLFTHSHNITAPTVARWARSVWVCEYGLGSLPAKPLDGFHFSFSHSDTVRVRAEIDVRFQTGGKRRTLPNSQCGFVHAGVCTPDHSVYLTETECPAVLIESDGSFKLIKLVKRATQHPTRNTYEIPSVDPNPDDCFAQLNISISAVDANVQIILGNNVPKRSEKCSNKIRAVRAYTPILLRARLRLDSLIN